MTDLADANRDQADYWTSPAGQKWIDHEAALDATLAPVLKLVLDRAALLPGQRVLDLGCGTGASTIRAAGIVGAAGHATGIDISHVMLDRAHIRAASAKATNVAFTLADAQTHPFAPAQYDIMISRFGMMFFNDPAAAFANIARAIRPGGRMVFAAWAAMPKNPWFTIPKDIAIARLGPPAPADPLAPGPFAFEDIARVSALMVRAGLRDVQADEVGIHLTPTGTASDAAAISSSVGPAVRILKERGGTPDDARAIEGVVAASFAAFDGPQGMRIPATINLFAAIAG
jgi:SAM-dependent methyltransferase